MLIAVWPLIIAVVGILLWVLATGTASEIGKWMFIIGLFWLVYGLAGKTLKLGENRVSWPSVAEVARAAPAGPARAAV